MIDIAKHSILVGSSAAETLSPFGGHSALFVDTDEVSPEPQFLSSATPCVTIGVGTPRVPAPDLDVLLTTAQDAQRPWVRVASAEIAVRDIAAAIDRNSTAAVALVQLLRIQRTLPLTEALIAESLTYAMLQAGHEFRHWLSTHSRVRSTRRLDIPVVVHREGGALTITFNRPDVHNAYAATSRDGLVEALRAVRLDSSISAVYLRGAGASFCSGGDLAEFGLVDDPSIGHLVRTTRSAALELVLVGDRVVAEVHGACIGAGIELAAFARHVVADPSTVIRLPELAMGLVPGAGGTASLARRIGRRRTAWLALTGATIDAQAALDWGLVDEVTKRQVSQT